MKIYTKNGDKGETGLSDGKRVAKDDLRVEAYGTVDELNATIGEARSLELEGSLGEILLRIQGDLFALGSELASSDTDKAPARLDPRAVLALESWIDLAQAELPPLRHFILPGGSPAACVLHRARTQCRRAERRVVSLSREANTDGTSLVYLNRLSDLLFVAARLCNDKSGTKEAPWTP